MDRLQAARERIEAQRKAKEGIDSVMEFMKLSEDLPPEKRYKLRPEIPEPYLEYADWFVKRTGIEPDMRQRGDWLAEFPYWSSKGLTIDDLEAAISQANFVVTRPGSITNLAIAIKAKKRATYHKPKIFRATEEIKAVPQPKDLFEKTRARLRAKAAQDLAGASAHEPKLIGDIMKGIDNNG